MLTTSRPCLISQFGPSTGLVKYSSGFVQFPVLADNTRLDGQGGLVAYHQVDLMLMTTG
jgi:hypothetical protein